jgi:hypothetical protein
MRAPAKTAFVGACRVSRQWSRRRPGVDLAMSERLGHAMAVNCPLEDQHTRLTRKSFNRFARNAHKPLKTVGTRSCACCDHALRSRRRHLVCSGLQTEARIVRHWQSLDWMSGIACAARKRKALQRHPWLMHAEMRNFMRIFRQGHIRTK